MDGGATAEEDCATGYYSAAELRSVHRHRLANSRPTEQELPPRTGHGWATAEEDGTGASAPGYYSDCGSYGLYTGHGYSRPTEQATLLSFGRGGLCVGLL